MRPLDVVEWLQEIRMLACRYPSKFPDGSADFALEALELVENDVSEEYWTLCDDLENLTDKKFPHDEPQKALEHLETELSAFENAADERSDAIRDALEHLSEARESLDAAVKTVEAIKPPEAPKLEYDL